MAHLEHRLFVPCGIGFLDEIERHSRLLPYQPFRPVSDPFKTTGKRRVHHDQLVYQTRGHASNGASDPQSAEPGTFSIDNRHDQGHLAQQPASYMYHASMSRYAGYTTIPTDILVTTNFVNIESPGHPPDHLVDFSLGDPIRCRPSQMSTIQ